MSENKEYKLSLSPSLDAILTLAAHRVGLPRFEAIAQAILLLDYTTQPGQKVITIGSAGRCVVADIKTTRDEGEKQ